MTGKKIKTIKGFKGFDSNLRCREYQFVVGKTEKMDEKNIKCCDNGFHGSRRLQDVFNFYKPDGKSRYCRVIFSGKIQEEENKIACSKIKIIKELSRDEIIKILLKENCGKGNIGSKNSGHENTGNLNTGNLNTGDRNSGDLNTGDGNSGDRNSGDRNSGYKNSGYKNSGYKNSGHKNSGEENTGDGNSGNENTGDRNTGDRNSGDLNTGSGNTGSWNTGSWNTGSWNTGSWNTGSWNTGSWNTGSWNTGFFNTKESDIINIFNKPCKKSLWAAAEKPKFIFNIVNIEWIYDYEMDSKEKKDNPEYKINGGYFKKIPLKIAWENAFRSATDDDIDLLKKLPNYNYKIFKKISGLSDRRLK